MSDSRASYWSITINNPTDDDKAQWSALGQQPWVKTVEGQLERGTEQGTLHIQGYVKTQHGRFLQKLRAALPRAHVEIAKNPTALVKYCKKEETRVGKIESVRTAGPGDVQNAVYQDLLYNGRNYYNNWNLDQDAFQENIQRYSYDIRQNWESHLDDAVKYLIKAGFYGVEFAAANQQIRFAFKKYLPEILYRCHAQATPVTVVAAPQEEDVCLIDAQD